MIYLRLNEEQRGLEKQLEIDWKAVNDVINENARTVQNQTAYKERYETVLGRYKQTEAKRKDVEGRISEKLA